MATSKKTRPIHSIHFRKDGMPHQILMCEYHLGILKLNLDKAESGISIPTTWSSEHMQCEACGRSHS